MRVGQGAVEEFPELLDIGQEYKVIGIWRKMNKVKLKTYPVLACWIDLEDVAEVVE